MDPLTVSIGKGTAKLLLKLGKGGIKKLLTEPLVHAAATNTQLEFEDIEVRDALIKWSESDDFVRALADLKEGESQDITAVVPLFIENTGFYAGDQTERAACRV